MSDNKKTLRLYWRGSNPGQELTFRLDDSKITLRAPAVVELSTGEVERANLTSYVEKGTLALEPGPPVRRSRHREWDGVYDWTQPNQPVVARDVR